MANVIETAADAAANGFGTIAILRHLHPYRDTANAEAQYRILMELGLPESPARPTK